MVSNPSHTTAATTATPASAAKTCSNGVSPQGRGRVSVKSETRHPAPDTLFFHSRRLCVERGAALPAAVHLDGEGEPEAAEEVRAERVARPVRAEVYAREPDEQDGQRRQPARHSAQPRAARQQREGHEEEEAEEADVKGNVSRREALVSPLAADAHVLHRRSRAR